MGLWDNSRTYAESQLVTARDFTGNPRQGVQPTSTPQGGSTNANVMAENDPDSPSYVVGGHQLGTPLAWIFVFFMLFVVVRGLMEATKSDANQGRFSELKVSVWNMFYVTMFAIPGIVITKTITIKYLDPNNPLRRLVAAV